MGVRAMRETRCGAGLLAAAATVAWLLGASACGRAAGPPPVGPPAPASDLVYYSTGDPGVVNAVDWTGQPRTPFALPPTPRGMPHYPGETLPRRLWIDSVSPDGSKILLGDGSIRDRAGRVLATLAATDGLRPTWADSSRHLCQLTTPGFALFTGGSLTGPAQLTWVTPGSRPRVVATVGQFGFTSSVDVLACSEQSGVAVIADRTASGVTQAAKTGLDPVTTLLVVRIADGSILYQRSYPVSAAPISGYVVAVSPDGRYAAETNLTLAARPAAPGGPTVIRELPSGAVVMTLEPLWVQGFSGDDGRIVVSAGPGLAATEVLEWRTGAVVWTAGASSVLAVRQPGGSALMVRDVANLDLWLVAADGSARQVAWSVGGVYGL